MTGTGLGGMRCDARHHWMCSVAVVGQNVGSGQGPGTETDRKVRRPNHPGLCWALLWSLLLVLQHEATSQRHIHWPGQVHGFGGVSYLETRQATTI